MLLATTRRHTTRRDAFTLLEVLVVVAILVILAGVATVATTRYLEDAKKTKAQLGCRGIAQAAENYRNSPQNPGVTDDEKWPTGIDDLIVVPFGGPSYLQNGQADKVDPWGKPYNLEQATRNDGTTYLLVYTTAPDGTTISQFGIGEQNARPKN